MPKERSEIKQNNSCNTPTYQNSTYFFKSTEEVIKYHKKEVNLGRYGRYTNPNWTEVEQCIAKMDAAEEALIFATGMNAITTTILSFIKPNNNIIFTGNCYRNTRTFFTSILSNIGINAFPISSANSEHFENSFFYQYNQLRPKIVFVEMPCNPHLYLVDIEKIKDTIDGETILIVDSTLSSAYNFKPCHFGADLVIHSCTKYVSGHGDIMAGSVAGSREFIDKIRIYRDIMGGIVDPHCSVLLNRSLKTFALRMEHYNQAGMKLALHLEHSPYVERVFYTGLDSHPHANLAKKYLTGHGGVVSFNVAGDYEATANFIDMLKIPFMGSNFGAHASMVEQCSIFTYYHYSDNERHELDISDNLVRLSVGYEDINLLIDDLDNAFSKALSQINLSQRQTGTNLPLSHPKLS